MKTDFEGKIKELQEKADIANRNLEEAKHKIKYYSLNGVVCTNNICDYCSNTLCTHCHEYENFVGIKVKKYET